MVSTPGGASDVEMRRVAPEHERLVYSLLCFLGSVNESESVEDFRAANDCYVLATRFRPDIKSR